MNTDDSIIQLPPIESLPRQTYPVKVLQFGTGNFLRGFADWMIQQANNTVGLNMGVAVVQSMGKDNLLARQQGRYTVIERSYRAGNVVSVNHDVHVIQRWHHASTNWQAVVEEACQPGLQFILSNTTEAGIEFKYEPFSETDCPTTFPGKLAYLLYKRAQTFPDVKIAVIPCELIERNGEVLRDVVWQYANAWNLGTTFATYLRESVSFCNTLVDRIVPGFPAEPEPFWHALGFQDHLLTLCEPYHLWVLEAPPWVQAALPLPAARLNVVFTDNLEPYRVRKVRILNGAHSILAPVGYLAGLTTVQEAMKHPVVGRFLSTALEKEIVPFVPGSAEEITCYWNEIAARFMNPAIRHELIAITLNSIAKYRVRLVPSVLAHIRHQQFVPERLAFAFAALVFFYRGWKSGEPIPMKDDPAVIRYFQERWMATRYTPESIRALVQDVLGKKEWWGLELASQTHFSERVAYYLYQIDQLGVLDVLRELNEDSML